MPDVKQGCVLNPLLYSAVLNEASKKAKNEMKKINDTGILANETNIADGTDVQRKHGPASRH